MKICLHFLLSIFLLLGFNAFPQADKTAMYHKTMVLYESKDYKKAAREFDKILSFTLSAKRLYDGACIYALNNEREKAFKILYFLAEKHSYSNYDHLSKDTDLACLHAHVKWAPLLEHIKRNKEALPQRKLATIAVELHKARQLLQADAGKLWGQPIWNDNILVLDYDNTIYSIAAFPGSKTNDGKLFHAAVPAGTFTFVNTVQSYAGKDYAIVLSNYLSDHSITIIHELFHLLQMQYLKLNGDAIRYLDNYDAREWLRLEYQALRNALNAIGHKGSRKKVTAFLEDALLFRKLRQSKYKEYLQSELEIETLEGLANYTGFALSTTSNKYEAAVEEIYAREAAQTYTRPFPYATGVAYGLLFDYLGIPWKDGLKKVYNFLSIYEHRKAIAAGETAVEKAKARNNFKQIHEEEDARRIKNENLLAYYRDLLHVKPTLQVTIVDEQHYGRTFNMNGTLEIPELGTVYSSIAGRDKSGKNFGSFKTIEDKAYLGNAGVLMLNDFKTFVFPAPVKIEGRKITGATYEIELNDGWVVEKADTRGNYLIRQQTQ